jgi:antitoxin MazE
MTVTTRIVRIGNSRGIRVPKLLLDRAALSDEVEIQAEPGRLVVSRIRRPRAGWAIAARTMHERKDDVELDAPTETRFDRSSWKW